MIALTSTSLAQFQKQCLFYLCSGSNSSSGTLLLEVPGFDYSFGGLFDVANHSSSIKGNWARTGGHTYRTQGSAIATDADGVAVYVMRLGCNTSVTEDCNVMDVLDCQMTLYVTDPANDPIPIWNRDPDVGPIVFPPQTGYRIIVE